MATSDKTLSAVPITRTKVLVPRRRVEILSRQRLIELLDDLLDCKLIVITAPAGYGKTSLLVDFAHQSSLPVCWYTLDDLDRDPQRFVAHFIASIMQRYPDFGRPSLAALQNISLSTLDIEQLVTVMVNDLFDHVPEHFLLVLDDYHLTENCQETASFISRFVQAVDENCHLIIASRKLITLPDLPLMIARSQASGLGFEELAFRPDEIQALLLQNYHLTISDTVAEELVRDTEGWITGLLLSAQTMTEGMVDRLRTARATGVGLYDYLAQQVLDRQPPAVRDFLLRTSLFDEFDARLCATVLGPAPGGESWTGLMAAAIQSNLFVLPVDDDETWLRYHHLFLEFLRARLTQEYPDERTGILRRLASEYAFREDWENAYATYQRLGDLEANEFAAIAGLIEQASLSMLRRGRLALLARWIDDLPGQMLHSRPRLVAIRGYLALMFGEVARGLTWLDQSVETCRAANDDVRRIVGQNDQGLELANVGHLSVALAWRATAHRFQGDYRASMQDADEALRLTGENEALRVVHAEAMKAKGLCLYRLGRLEQAADWLAQSLATYDSANERHNAAMTLMDLGLVSMNSGHYDQAMHYYHRALDYWRSAENIVQQANLLNNLGVLHHLSGHYEQAVLTLEEALDCARQSAYARIEALALTSIGDVYADLEALDTALEVYRQAREIAQRIHDRLLLLYLELAEAAVLRLGGELALAYQRLEGAGQLLSGSESSYEQGLWQQEAGQLALAGGDFSEAAVHLEAASDRFEVGGHRVEAARANLYLALAYRSLGNEGEAGCGIGLTASAATASAATAFAKVALDRLGRVFRQESSLGSPQPVVIAGREAKPLLETAQADPDIGRQASLLLLRVERFEAQVSGLRRRLRRQVSTVPIAPPRLTFRAFGGAQVIVGQELVSGADWEARVARDVLFCLLAHPEGLTKEAIGEIFWPDCSPAQLKPRFKKTIYRLRRVLGQEVVLFERDRYWFNHAVDYDYDVEIFLDNIQLARTAADQEKRVTAYRAAVNLYRGPYLPEIEGMWVAPLRERLWQVYREAVLKLAEHDLATGALDQALEHCQRALHEDPALEEAHGLIMRIYAAMGNRVAVVRQFERCRQALREELDVSPSPQTEALYEMLMR